jgi:hypothetical protein
VEEDAGTDALGIGRKSAEGDSEAGGGGTMEEQGGGGVETVDDDIEVAVVVEIGEAKTVGDIGISGPVPEVGGVLEAQVSEVAEGEVFGEERRVLEEFAGDLVRTIGTGGVDTFLGIEVLSVEEMAGSGEEILIAIEVHIEKGDTPGPAGGVEAGEVGDFGEGGIASIKVESVARQLRLVVGGLVIAGDGHGTHALDHPKGVVRIAHIGDEEIVVAVAVDVGEVHGHGEGGGAAGDVRGSGAEAAGTIIEPKSVGAMEVTADIEIGPAIVVQVAEGGGEAPIEGGTGEGLSGGIEEVAGGPGDGGELAAAVVEVEDVGFAVFENATVGEVFESILILGSDTALAADIEHTEAGTADGIGAVIGDVEIEVTIAVDIGEGEGGGAEAWVESGVGGGGEAAGAIVEEEGSAMADGIDEEIEVAIAIDVGEGGAGGMEVRKVGTGRGGDIGESGAAEVAINLTATTQTAEEKVHPAVAIDIAGGDAGAVEEDLVTGGDEGSEGIGKWDTGGQRRDGFKADRGGRGVGWLKWGDDGLRGAGGGGEADQQEHQEARTQRERHEPRYRGG